MKLAVRMRIVVNGKTYGSVDELPQDLRSAYGKAVAAGAAPVAGGRLVAPGRERPDPAIEPVGVSRWTMAFVVASAVLVLWYVLRPRG